MIEQIKGAFPEWVNDTEENYELMLTDDIDSLVSCALLRKIKGYEINYFYDFKSIYEINDSQNKAIAVDASLTQGKCWDNHVTMLSRKDSVNKESANLNNILEINRDNYFQKFCGSTAIQIWSYYGLPLPESEEGKMALLAIDGGFLGHYDTRFIEIHSKYLNAMEFSELIEVLERHTKSEFFQLEQKYNLKRKIELNKDGRLSTNIDLSALEGLFLLDLKLPNQQFTIRNEFSRDYPTQLGYGNYIKDDFPEMLSVALINKNRVAFTKK